MEAKFVAFFLTGLIVFYFLGGALKKHLKSKKEWAKGESMGTVEGSLLALFAFFLGFTFSISASKLENVRQSSILESNAIGTVILRTKMYDDKSEKYFKALIKDYLKTRIDYFDKDSSHEDDINTLNIGQKKSDKIWDFAVDLQKSKIT